MVENKKDRRNSRFAIVAACCLAFAALYFVYPTPWVITTSGTDIYRANRITGVKEFASAQGWQRDGVAVTENRGQDLSVMGIRDYKVLVKNTSQRPFDGQHYVTFTVLDNQGINLGSASDVMQNLKPGEVAELNLNINSADGSVYQRVTNARVDSAN